MTTLLISILAFALTAGQLIKIPFLNGGITILDITLILFCFLGLIKIKFRLKRPPIQIRAALIFIFLAFFSLLLTPLHLNLSEYLSSFSYTIRLALYILFVWLVSSDAFGEFRQNLKKTLLLSGISFTVLGLLQFIFFPNLDFLKFAGWDPHYFRAVSTFLDPNFAGAFLVLTLILLVSLRTIVPQSGRAKTTRQSLLAFALIYLALLTTFSRSSYAMFLISGLVFSFLKKSIKLCLATLILFVILLFGFRIYSQMIATPRNIDRTQSASFRLNTWQQGLTLFKKSPVLGIGFNSYRFGIKQYNLGDQQFLESHGSSGNDSSLLFVASTTGILGLAAYLYFLWTLLISFKQQNFILTVAVTGLIIHSFFANSLFYPPILAWILIISVVSKK